MDVATAVSMSARWMATRPRLIMLCAVRSRMALVPLRVALIAGKMAYWLPMRILHHRVTEKTCRALNPFLIG